MILVSTTLLSKEQWSILKGRVYDPDTKEPLISATIKVQNEKRGAYTNNKGEFVLKLPRYKIYRLTATMVGHITQEKEINIDRDTVELNFELRSSEIESPDLIVYADDPLTRLIKRIIRKKNKQKDSLERYTYMLYTKFVFSTDTLTAGRTDYERDTTINSILESYSEGFYKKKDNYFNRIIQKRQSINVPPQANFVSFGTNINAYDDFVNFLEEDIATPFHPDALDFYKYEVIGTFKSDKKRKLTKIKITPITTQRRLFDGTITVDEELDIPVSVDLTPNVAVQLPLNAKLKFNQDFEFVDSQYVVPSRMRIYASSKFSILWVYSPRIDVLIETGAYDYKINQQYDDGVFDERRVEIADGADIFNEEFWNNNQVVPLSSDEQRAYSQILTARDNPDSVQGSNFFTQYLAPINRFFANFNRAPFTGIEDLFKYNRVYGLYLGSGVRYSPYKTTDFTLSGGMSIADERLYGEFKIQQYFDEKRRFGLDGSLFDKLSRRDEPYTITNRTITFLSGLFKSDYGDYYYSKGYELGLSAGLGQLIFLRRDNFQRPYLLRAYYKDEYNSSADVNTSFALFNWSRPFRANPQILEGKMRSGGVQLYLNYTPERRISDAGLYFEFENSGNSIGSDFDFRQYYLEGNLRTRTLPLWNLDIRIAAGYTDNLAPPQRYFSNESSSANIVTGGALRNARIKEFYGDRFISTSIEHNFGEVFPGLLRIPSIAEIGIEFIGLFNVAYFDFSPLARQANSKSTYPYQTTSDTQDKYYYEVGLGFNRILFFFRVDLTTRLSQISSPRFIVNFTGATN